jgi:hypothetical protein
MLNITILLYFFKYKNVMLNYNFNSLQGTLYQEIARIQLQCSETIGVNLSPISRSPHGSSSPLQYYLWD